MEARSHSYRKNIFPFKLTAHDILKTWNQNIGAPDHFHKQFQSSYFSGDLQAFPLYMTMLHSRLSQGIAYRQTSGKSRTKSKHLNVSRLVLQLSLPDQFKPGVKVRMMM